MVETEEQRLKRIFVDYADKRLIKNIIKIQEGKNDTITKTRFLTLVREETDKADSELYDCLLSGEQKSHCYSKYGAAIGTTNTIIENLRSDRKSKSFYLPCISNMLDDESLIMIKEINNTWSYNFMFTRIFTI